MAFNDLVQQLGDDPSSEPARRAVELREQLTDNPNNIEAFEELASIVRAAEDRVVLDPLTADSDEAEASADLALWSLAEDLGSDSRAWYPLIMLAKLAINDDVDSALRHLENAADREETGIALAQGVHLLRESGHNGAAEQLGLGRWKSQQHTHVVGEELTLAALADGKLGHARQYIEYLESAGADADVVERLAALVKESE